MNKDVVERIIRNASERDKNESLRILENCAEYNPNGTVSDETLVYQFGDYKADCPIKLRALIIRDYFKWKYDRK
jgi:hypothetical protein